MLRKAAIRFWKWWVREIDKEISAVWLRESELYIRRARAEKRLAALCSDGRD